MGIIVDNVQAAFSQLKRGNFKAFSKKLADTADRNILYDWHRGILDKEVEKQLKGISCKKEGDKLICEFKKAERRMKVVSLKKTKKGLKVGMVPR